MARLFIFAIGGTGSRVLKSLSMLLAAGIKPQSQQEFEIVPIIIDPHSSNKDLLRTERLLNNYQSITDTIGFESGFFNTKISTLDKLVDSENNLSKSFTFNLQQVANTSFRDYIDLNNQSEASASLSDILFSGKSINKRGEEIDLMDTQMDIGFIGNPNMGSVVLNQFKDSVEFKEFASNFHENDRIFIISSIFGGTGAAGFPSVLKNIRDAMHNEEIDSKANLRDAKIGALSVLPYFNIEKSSDSPIQKSDFIAKTKAALHYYKNNVTGNNSLNALYYIADDHSGKPYENDPGENGQQNDAHYIEMISALAIIDFLEISDHDLLTSDGKATNPLYKEFGLRNDSDTLKFSDLNDITESRIGLKLSQLSLFRKFIGEHLSKSVEIQPWGINEPSLGSSFASDPFYRTYLTEFFIAYGNWLDEMKSNRRSCSFFNLTTPLPSFITDREIKAGFLSKKVDYKFFDEKLNYHSKNKNYPSSSHKIIDLFFKTTEDILTSKFGFKK